MKQAFIYSSKVWLSVIVVAPIVGIAILYYRFTDQMFRLWEQVTNALIIGIELAFFYYLLAWFVFALVSAYLNGKLTDRSRKILLLIIAVLLSMTPFIAMDYHSLFTDETGIFAGFPPSLMWTCTCAGVAFAAVWFYKLKPKAAGKNQVETNL